MHTEFDDVHAASLAVTNHNTLVSPKNRQINPQKNVI